MKVSDLVSYLIDLERKGFTGKVTLNFHKGDVSKHIGIEKRVSVEK